MSHSTPLTRALLHPPSSIVALVHVLAEAGVPADAALEGSGLQRSALDDACCPTSIDQHRAVCANAMRLSTDPTLALRAGARMRLSGDGVYGLMLLSSESVRDYFALATRYRLLSASTVGVESIEVDDRAVCLVVDDVGGETRPQALRTFLVEQQFARQVVQLEDVLGARCRPVRACFAHPAPAHRARYEEILGCPCEFDRPRFELWYPVEVLARRPYLANPLGARTLRSTCDDLLADIGTSLGFAGRVYRALRRLSDPGVGMKAVASQLKMTDRTLRRRLADEGTSYSTISHDVRCAVASRQLRHSEASIEQIAAATGFSDPANFRRAFIRWTSMSPAQFRRRLRG